MKKNYKRCRYINESYTDIYLSIPGILATSILFIIGCVTVLLKIADGNIIIDKMAVSRILASLHFLLIFFLYFYAFLKIFITIKDNRGKNDKNH